MQWGYKLGALYPQQTNAYLQILWLFTDRRGRRGNVAIFCNYKRTGIEAPNALLEALIATKSQCRGEWERENGLPNGKHGYLFANLFLFTSGEGDEGIVSLYFQHAKAVIERFQRVAESAHCKFIAHRWSLRKRLLF